MASCKAHLQCNSSPTSKACKKIAFIRFAKKRKDDEPSGFELMRHVYFSPINK
jgi:hypothetical protein